MARGFWRFYEKANDVVRFFTGPAQIGAGYDEGPEVRPSDPACPICAQAMSLHRIERHADDKPTRLHCPSPVANDAA